MVYWKKEDFLYCVYLDGTRVASYLDKQTAIHKVKDLKEEQCRLRQLTQDLMPLSKQ